MRKYTVLLLILMFSAVMIIELQPREEKVLTESEELSQEEIIEIIINLREQIPILSKDIQNLQRQLIELEKKLGPHNEVILIKAEEAVKRAQREADWQRYLVYLFFGLATILFSALGFITWSKSKEASKDAKDAEKHAENAKEIVLKEIPKFIQSGKSEIKNFIEEVKKQIDFFTKESEEEIKKIVQDEMDKIKKEADKQRETSDLFAEAGRLTKEKLYDRALQEWDKVIEKDPNEGEAYRYRGNIKDNKGDYEGAIADYTKGISIQLKAARNVSAAMILSNRGDTRRIIADYEGAIDDCTEAIKLKPDCATAFNNRGFTYAKGLKQFPQAIKDLNEAIGINPYHEAFHSTRGYIYAGLGESEKAIEDFERALKMNNNDSEIWYDYACALALLKNRDGMFKKLKKAIELNSKHKKEARKDLDFKDYREDVFFKSLTE